MSPKQMAHQAYNQAFHTVGKTRQVVMLYDGIIRFLMQAREAIANKQIEERYRLLVKASDVIIGLQGCLDFESGGSVARILYDFYSSVDARIITIQRTNNLELCDTLIAELKEMREAWSTIDQNTPHSPSPSAVAAPVSPFLPQEMMVTPSPVQTQHMVQFSNDITV